MSFSNEEFQYFSQRWASMGSPTQNSSNDSSYESDEDYEDHYPSLEEVVGSYSDIEAEIEEAEIEAANEAKIEAAIESYFDEFYYNKDPIETEDFEMEDLEIEDFDDNDIEEFEENIINLRNIKADRHERLVDELDQFKEDLYSTQEGLNLEFHEMYSSYPEFSNKAKWIVNNYRREKKLGLHQRIYGDYIEYGDQIGKLFLTKYIDKIYVFRKSVEEFVDSDGIDMGDDTIYDYESIDDVLTNSHYWYFNKRIDIFNDIIRAVDRINNKKRVKSILDKEELIAAAMHPNRIMKQMQYYDDMEMFFENL